MTKARPQDVLGGSWIIDSGPGQFKMIVSYIPCGEGKLAAVAFPGIDFGWTLGGLKPTAAHATTFHGVVEVDEQGIGFSLVGYILDNCSKPVYILKAVGRKIVVDQDTLRVENLVFQFYNDPETANPVTDKVDFCVPADGTFPPIREYRIQLKR